MLQTDAAISSISVISNHGFAEIRQNVNTKQKSLHALCHFTKGQVISEFQAGEIYKSPNYLTVQTGKTVHITLVPVFLQYINHSCTPNVFFNTTTMEVIALRDINEHEELCFFYPSTEWEMAQPFFCYCGSIECLQNIQGAKHLSPDQVRKYTFTDFIQSQLNIS